LIALTNVDYDRAIAVAYVTPYW